jgi:hypothetical protein
MQVLENASVPAILPVLPTPLEATKDEIIETSAEFLGGINLLRSAFATTFDTSVFSGTEGFLKANLNFKIDGNPQH